jgi:hypothetical protein
MIALMKRGQAEKQKRMRGGPETDIAEQPIKTTMPINHASFFR